MCLAIPARVLKVREDRSAQVDVAGSIREASLQLLPEVEAGDYVLLYLGCAVSRVEPEEAEEILLLHREMAQALEAEW